MEIVSTYVTEVKSLNRLNKFTGKLENDEKFPRF